MKPSANAPVSGWTPTPTATPSCPATSVEVKLSVAQPLSVSLRCRPRDHRRTRRESAGGNPHARWFTTSPRKPPSAIRFPPISRIRSRSGWPSRGRATTTPSITSSCIGVPDSPPVLEAKFQLSAGGATDRAHAPGAAPLRGSRPGRTDARPHRGAPGGRQHDRERAHVSRARARAAFAFRWRPTRPKLPAN